MMEDSHLISLDLGSTSKETIELFADEASDPAIFKEILESNRARPEIVKLLCDHPNTPDDVRSEAARTLDIAPISGEEALILKRREAERKARELQEKYREDRLMKRIKNLTVSEKIKFALRGNKEARSVLLADSNKLVVLSVLENPMITEPEVEAVARSRSVVEDALRAIAKNREWLKKYSIQLALVTNPKTPVAISMQLVPNLKKKELMLLEKNKNVPEGVRAAARKFVKLAKR
jgi:hypothetical protein